MLALLLPLHLPAMLEELPGVVKSIFFLLQRGGATASLTMQACFKALTVLLREAKGKLQLSPSQVLTLAYLYVPPPLSDHLPAAQSEPLPAPQCMRCTHIATPTTTYYCILMRTHILECMLVYCCI